MGQKLNSGVKSDYIYRNGVLFQKVLWKLSWAWFHFVGQLKGSGALCLYVLCRLYAPMRLSVRAKQLCVFSPSAVPGDDHQTEAHWPPGAMPLLPRWGRDHLSVGLLPLQPATGAQGGLQLWTHARGALSGCQSDWGAAQGEFWQNEDTSSMQSS